MKPRKRSWRIRQDVEDAEIKSRKFRFQRRMLELLKRMGATHCIAEDAGWLRVRNGYGLHWTRNEPLFSERNGYVRKLRIPFTRWRVGILRPDRGWLNKPGT